MKNKLLFTFCFLISLNSYSQGTLALNFGTDFIGLRAGFKFNDKFEAGIKYAPSINLLYAAGFKGIYAKYNMGRGKITKVTYYSTYFIANWGQISPPDYTYEEFLSRPPWITTTTLDFKRISGGSVGYGFEYGSEKFKYLAEFGIGRMPNTYKSTFSDPYSSGVRNADTKKAFTAPYHLTFGCVFYFD